jgi:predicted dehydrogenase
VRAFCYFGKHRNIEVEDEVTGYMEFENGATGVFVTTVSETPGTNRFEIVGERGKIVIENDKLMFSRLRVPEPVTSQTHTGFTHPESWQCEIPIPNTGFSWIALTRDWIQSILTGSPLLAPGLEGINGLRLSNAMLLSTWEDNWVDMPMDDELFYSHLQEKIKTSKTKEHVNEQNAFQINMR